MQQAKEIHRKIVLHLSQKNENTSAGKKEKESKTHGQGERKRQSRQYGQSYTCV